MCLVCKVREGIPENSKMFKGTETLNNFDIKEL